MNEALIKVRPLETLELTTHMSKYTESVKLNIS